MARRVSTQRKIGMTVLAWAVGLLIFFPILWTVLTSFKTELDAISIPAKVVFFDWTTENYVAIQEQRNYFAFLLNSVYLSLGSTALGLVFAFPPPGPWPSRRRQGRAACSCGCCRPR